MDAHPAPTTTAGPGRRARSASALVALTMTLLLLATACGGGDGGAPAAAAGGDPGDGTVDETVVLREPAESVGPDPFTTEVDAVDLSTEVAAMPATDRDAGDDVLHAGTAPGLYGGSGEVSTCDPETLVAFLESHPDEATAWAGVIGIAPDEIGAYVAGLRPLVLLHDTRVTNHGFVDGRATPRQSVLQAGTAVLVDVAGMPRTRCACGNPLAPAELLEDAEYRGPSWPGAEEPVVPVPGPIQPIPAPPIDEAPDEPEAPTPPSFCEVWTEVEPTIAGGPSGPGDVAPYVQRALEGFTRLVAAAEQTPDFPEEALAKLTQFRDDLAAWSGVGSPGSTALRDWIEAFLTRWCGEEKPPPFQEPGDPGDDAGDEQPDDDLVDDDYPWPDAQCGSFMLYMLVYAADELGVDHTGVSQPYLDAIEDLYAGVDPGEEWDVGDLDVMFAVEEVGCQGAQAVYELLVDEGYGDELLIEP